MRVMSKIKLETRLAANRLHALSRAEDRSCCQWGIVGTGYMGEQFSRYLGQTEGSNVRSVCSRNAERARRFMKRHGAVASYADLADMLNAELGRLDVVYIATPASTHYGIAMQCLEGGFNVLCEKPLCETLDQARRLFETADENGALLVEGMWSSFLPTYKKAEAWIAEGKIGQVRHVEAAIRKPKQGGEKSCLFDFGAYAVSFVVTFLGEGRWAVSGTSARDGEGADRRWDVDIIAPSGATAAIHLSTDGRGDSSAEITGSNGSIRFPSQFNRTNVIELRDAGGEVREHLAFDYSHLGFEHEISSVASSVKGDLTAVGTSRVNTFATISLMEVLAATRGESFSFETGCK